MNAFSSKSLSDCALGCDLVGSYKIQVSSARGCFDRKIMSSTTNVLLTNYNRWVVVFGDLKSRHNLNLNVLIFQLQETLASALCAQTPVF